MTFAGKQQSLALRAEDHGLPGLTLSLPAFFGHLPP